VQDRDLVDALHQIGQMLGTSDNLEESLHNTLTSLCERMGMERATLSLNFPEEGELAIDLAVGLSETEIARGRYKIGEGITGRVVETGEPVIVPQISREPLFLNRTGAREDGVRSRSSFICVPIHLQQEVIGTLSADTPHQNETLLEEKVRLLSILSAMIGQAVAARRTSHREQTRLMRENRRLQEQLRERFHPTNIIGSSRPMQDVCTQIGQVAQSDATVLIRGESGTGKELIADALHHSSLRGSGPFIKVHVAALPETLVEAELFGHEKGAFTGAGATKAGRFERADGGTLFLDEIGELSQNVQIKLLRVLQTREIERVGATRTQSVDVRIIAATHVDLEEAVKAGRFREDLFYRLNVFPLYIPPLRERKSDIVLLADHFLEKYGKKQGKPMQRISTPAIDMVMSYHWPGNVRELENCIERAVILSTDGVVHGHHLPPSLQTAAATGTKLSGSFDIMMASYEREILIEALKNARGNVAKAARLLHTTHRIVSYRCRKLDIGTRRYRS
jgi:Nif-specific regulatory protein